MLPGIRQHLNGRFPTRVVAQRCRESVVEVRLDATEEILERIVNLGLAGQNRFPQPSTL
jgi:hypothetical protein